MASEDRERTIDRDGRYELKFAVEGGHARAAGLDLRLRLLGLSTLFPDRTVQTLNLDDHRLTGFDENLSGASDRKKVRLRWYGEGGRGVRARLEVKSRRAERGTKAVVDVPTPLDVEGAFRADFVKRLQSTLPPEARAILARDLEPAQWIVYRRSYFSDADGDVRVTLDRDLVCASQFERVRLSSSRPSVRSDLWIVEVKALVAATESVRRVAQSLGASRGRCSKYAFATDEEAGPIPSVLERW
ncbi:MAG: VTC domain-containing protein [Planctomycetota bacterium]